VRPFGDEDSTMESLGIGVTGMADNCARCGQKVKSEENWMCAHLWGNSAVLHWNCYIALLRSEGTPGAEEATWKGDRHEHANK
jgi:hypothetical protein